MVIANLFHVTCLRENAFQHKLVLAIRLLIAAINIQNNVLNFVRPLKTESAASE